MYETECGATYKGSGGQSPARRTNCNRTDLMQSPESLHAPQHRTLTLRVQSQHYHSARQPSHQVQLSHLPRLVDFHLSPNPNHPLRLNEHRHNAPCRQPKCAMPNSQQQRCDSSRVTSERDPSTSVVHKDVIKQPPEPHNLLGFGFADVGEPERVLLCEVRLDRVAGVGGADPG